MNLELWGGIECTVNRVGTRTFDQVKRSGHETRLEDLDRFAELGLKTLRYPVLWERVQPEGPDDFDWSWSDERLNHLRELGIRPLVGLLHHGSGPRWTDLLDPEFPAKFARYALAVARRYPWIVGYVPVNEPLTTARFSGLYGHWFPHEKDNSAFLRALLNQVEGVGLAMAAIRSVQPAAELVQTEDLGKSFGTELLRYQCDFENERRWITFDLLLGKVKQSHPLWNFLIEAGGDRTQLERISDHPCAPDILGVNYYVTSERYLDEDLDKYPPETHGGNIFHRYADVAAVRAREEGLVGIGSLLREMWGRYRAPMAVTEAHMGCTREEQVRWLAEIWKECQALRRDHIDCRAVTAWALLGTFDWNSLVTEQNGDYEPGAFDLRSGEPRPTAIAGVIRSLAREQDVSSPVLQTPGWWRRHERLPHHLHPERIHPAARGPGILVLGGRGNLGQAFGRICESRGLGCHLLSRYDADVGHPASVRNAIERYRPWAVINAAGYTFIDEAEADAEQCHQVNGEGAVTGARLCAEAGIPYVTFSSDLVFDGRKEEPYSEFDVTGPLSVFGRSKVVGETKIALEFSDALVIRSSGFFSPWSMAHFPAEVLRPTGELVVPEGLFSPTYLPDLCHAALDLLVDGERGIWHLTNQGQVTWQEFAEMLAERFGAPVPHLRIAAPTEFAARRPTQSVLISERGAMMPSLENALSRFRHEFGGMLQKPAEVEAIESGRD
jgi:dTDP-4-dehydrorhamnose reductase